MFTRMIARELLENEGSDRKILTLPIKRQLGPAYLSSLFIALLAGIAAGGALWWGDAIYVTEEARLAFLPVDLFHLVVGLPVLLGSTWLARRGSLVGLLCWAGALLYVLYSYVTNLIGVPFGPLFLPYLLLVTLSAYTLIALVGSFDGDVVRRRLDAKVPARAAAVLLMGLSGLFMVNAVVEIASALAESATASPLERMLWIADMGTMIPLGIAGAILLWRRNPLGYIAGPGLLLAYTMLFFGLLPAMAYPALYNGSPVDGVGMALMLALGLLCLVLFFRFMRAASAAE